MNIYKSTIVHNFTSFQLIASMTVSVNMSKQLFIYQAYFHRYLMAYHLFQWSNPFVSDQLIKQQLLIIWVH